MARLRGHVPIVVRQKIFKTNVNIDRKPRPDVRIDVRGIVIRIRIRHTAIRIRVVVRPIDHTGLLGKSAFSIFDSSKRRRPGRIPPRTTDGRFFDFPHHAIMLIDKN